MRESISLRINARLTSGWRNLAGTLVRMESAGVESKGGREGNALDCKCCPLPFLLFLLAGPEGELKCLWMQRIVHKARTFAEAEAWERKQYQEMTPVERMRAAREIKERLFPGKRPDVRECHKNNR